MKPRIVIDAAALAQPGADRGLGAYSRALLAATSELDTFSFLNYPGRASGHGRFSDWWDIPHRARFVATHGPYYHATSAYHVDPTHLSTSAVSILDLIPLELPAYRQTGVKARAFFALAKRAAVILTLSEHTKKRVTALLGVPQERIVVASLPIVRPAADTEPHDCGCPRLSLEPGAYAISVIDAVTVDPRKRLPWLLGAGHVLSKAKLPLVLLGRGTHELNAEGVIGLGRLCDFHMAQAVSNAVCFVYASAYEGQGLPPQEALCAGTPVVSFRNSSLPEMLGDGAEWLTEPPGQALHLETTDAADAPAVQLAEAVLRLKGSASRREELVRAGQSQLARFTEGNFRAAVGSAYSILTRAS